MSDKEQEAWDRLMQKLNLRELLVEAFRPMAKEYFALRNDPFNSYFTLEQMELLFQLQTHPKPPAEMTEEEQLVWTKYKYGGMFTEIKVVHE